MAEAYLEQAVVTLLDTVESAYWEQAPQEAKTPFIVASLITSGSYNHSLGPSGKYFGTVQVDVYADSIATRAATARKIRQRLVAHKGVVVIDNDSLFIDSFTLSNVRTSKELAGGEDTFYRSSMDFYLTWNEE